MRVAVGIDVAKTAHWVTAIDDAGTVLIDRSVANEPDAIEELIAELRSLEGEVTIGLDVVGGIAGLVEAMVAAASFRLVHVPGLVKGRPEARPRAIPGMPASSPTKCAPDTTCGRSRPAPRSTSSCVSWLDAGATWLTNRPAALAVCTASS